MDLADGSRRRRIYQAGDLRIDLGRATVRRGEELLHVQGLSFDLLALLVESAPNLVTHDQMLARIWPGLVVGPETVSQRVKLLRAALGDDSRAPRYIEVVRGRGCRMVVDVRARDEAASQADPPAPAILAADALRPSAQASPVPQSRRGWRLLAALAVMAVGGAALMLVQRGSGARVAAAPAMLAPDFLSRPAVAVLPFDTMASGPDDRVLVLGIAETLLHQLAQSPELVVISRESSFAAARDRGLTETSRLLHADLLVTGSVQREAQMLRITMHLVDAQSGTQLWSRRFDRPGRDLFSLQDEIASDVAAALRLNVEQRRQISSPRSGTRDLQAWLAYQRGRERLALRSRDELSAASAEFEAALAADPRFAAAMVALAETRILRAMSADSEFWGNSRPDMSDAERGDALRLISNALQIDAANGEAYAARAWLQQDRDLALRDARRGAELAPNNATALRRLAQLVYFVPGNRNGYDHDARLESLRLLQRAERVDPLSAPTLLMLARGQLYSFGNFDEAQRIAERLTVEHPDFYPGWVQLGEVLWCCRGEVARGIVALERARQLDPHARWTRDFLSQAYLDVGDVAAARAVIAGPEFVQSGTHGAILLMEGRYREAVQRGIRYMQEGSSGLNAAVLVQALYAETAIGRPGPESLEAAALMERLSGHLPEAVALVAAQQLRMGNESSRAVLRKAIDDIRDIAYRRGRSDLFLLRPLTQAQLAAGDLEGALDSFVRSQAPGHRSGAYWFTARNPLLDPLRSDPRFIQAWQSTQQQLAKQRREVERLRAEGKLPRYSQQP